MKSANLVATVAGILLAVAIAVVGFLVRVNLRIRDQNAQLRVANEQYVDANTKWGVAYQQLTDTHNQYLAGEKKRNSAAITRSRAVRTGQVGQHLAPLLPNFGFDPADVQWVGGVIDMIVFHGLSIPGAPVRIVLRDIKSRHSKLNDNQKRVREAWKAGRVDFDVYELPAPESSGLRMDNLLDLDDIPYWELPNSPHELPKKEADE